MSPLPPGRTRPLAVPHYGDTLADLLPSVLGALGVPGELDTLGLPPAPRYVVLLIDGLGWQLLRRHPAEAPFLSSLLGAGRPLSVCAPTTTATSLTSLGTGLAPGRHGIVGYTSRVPATGALLNALSWDQPVDPLDHQPYPTVFERAARAGVATSVVSMRRFRGSGLTQAGLRGPGFTPADTLGERVAAAAAAARAPAPAMVYVYDGDLDTTGHARGLGSSAWRHQLGFVDRFAETLYEALPADAMLVVTGDHGMVDVPFERRVDLDAEPALQDGVQLVGGEARLRHVYVRDGAADDVAAAWAAFLGDQAVVRTRAAAVAEGWFGAVEERVAPRLGDVIVSVTGDCAVVVPSAFPLETRILGLHGALTEDELLVPLLVAAP